MRAAAYKNGQQNKSIRSDKKRSTSNAGANSVPKDNINTQLGHALVLGHDRDK